MLSSQFLQRFEYTIIGNSADINTILSSIENINEADESGQTLLMIAAQAMNEEVVALLLQRGADPEIRDRYGLSAEHYARLIGAAGLVDLLRSAARSGSSY